MSTKEFLITAGPEKLADILLHLQDCRDDMKKHFEMLFQGLDPNPKKLISMIKKEIGALSKAKAGAKDQKVILIKDRLEQLRYSIFHDLKILDMSSAKAFLWEFMDLNFPTLYRLYTHHDLIIHVFQKACVNLGELYKESPPDKIQDLITLIIERISSVRFFRVYEGVILAFKDVLGKEGLDLLAQKLEAIAKKENISAIKPMLQKIADAKKDVDAYIKASKLITPLSTEDYLSIAERLIERWRGDEAIKYLVDADVFPAHSLSKRKMQLQLQALELLGEYERAQKERIAYFKQTLEIWMYGEILKYATSEKKEDFIQEALDYAMSHPDFDKGLKFLMEMKELVSAGKMIRLRIDQVKRIFDTGLSKYALELSDFDPLAAVLIHRKFIDGLNGYSYDICKLLILCEKLKDKINDWETYEPHESYLLMILKKYQKDHYFQNIYQQSMDAYYRTFEED